MGGSRTGRAGQELRGNTKVFFSDEMTTQGGIKGLELKSHFVPVLPFLLL